MTDQLRAAAEAALEAIQELEYSSLTAVDDKIARDAKQMLRSALAERGHLRDATKMIGEPVAWVSDSSTRGNGKRLFWTRAEAWRWSSNLTPLYTAAPRREWQSLTQEELEAALGLTEYDDLETAMYMIAKANAIEAALKEKNHD